MTFAIVPDGPIQFFHFELDVSGIPKITTLFVETEHARSQDHGTDWHLTCLAQKDGKLIDLVTGQVLLAENGAPALDHPNQYSVSLPSVIQQFRDRWVPLPYLLSVVE